MEALLPFRVEYAETSLIICEKCKDNINIGSIKIGIMQEVSVTYFINFLVLK